MSSDALGTPDAGEPDRAPSGHELDVEFDRAIAPRAIAPGTYELDVDAGFTVGSKPNGGYLLAAIGRATGVALGEAGCAHRDPLAATAHYLRAPDVGPATIAVEVLRTGRTTSQARATLSQGDRRCVDVTLTMGEIDPAVAPVWSVRPPIDVPPADDCVRVPAASGAFVVATMDRCDLRLSPSSLEWATVAPSGRGELTGWIGFADGRPIDPVGLLFLLDAMPPATIDIARSGWVPTLSLTTYVRAIPAPGLLRVRQAIGVVADGRIDEVCELWDADGHLVAHSSQLAVVRFDDPDALAPPPS
jgi:hypothetical protein